MSEYKYWINNPPITPEVLPTDEYEGVLDGKWRPVGVYPCDGPMARKGETMRIGFGVQIRRRIERVASNSTQAED